MSISTEGVRITTGITISPAQSMSIIFLVSYLHHIGHVQEIELEYTRYCAYSG